MSVPKETRSRIREIDPRSLYQEWLSGRAPRIIDVRSSPRYLREHVPDACSVPLEDLDPASIAPSSEPIYVICEIGVRSLVAAGRLADSGHSDVVNVTGGTRAWREAGLPVVHETPRSLTLRRRIPRSIRRALPSWLSEARASEGRGGRDASLSIDSSACS